MEPLSLHKKQLAQSCKKIPHHYLLHRNASFSPLHAKHCQNAVLVSTGTTLWQCFMSNGKSIALQCIK
jgi:hypothetical protein